MRNWLLFPAIFLAACGTDDTDTDTDVVDTDDTDVEADEANDLVGVWVDNYHSVSEVTATAWTSYGLVFTITAWDDEARWIVASNAPDDPYNPGKWSRFDWAVVDDATWYCQTAFSAATEAEALATPAADATNLASGCGGFGWSGLRPVLAEISGTWTDNWGGGHRVDAWAWESGDATFDIEETDTAARWVAARNGDANAYNPGKYSVFEWMVDGTDVFYCQSSYDAADLAAAIAAKKADRADLDAGCGGFGWSTLEAAK